MKKILALTLLVFVLLSPCLATSAFAAGEVQKQTLPTSPLYLVIKIKEAVQQFLTFNTSSKAELLENFAEQRIREMEYANFSEDNDALGASLDRYQAQKTRALGYVLGASDSKVMDQIRERTVEQQGTMTKMQLEIEGSEGVQERIVEVQREIAGETKRTVEIVQGVDEADEMDNKMHYVWLDPNADTDGDLPPLPDEIKEWEYAPGTEGRDGAGKVVEITYAPGTTAGGGGGETVKIEWAVDTGPPTIATDQGDGGDVKKVIIQQAPKIGNGGDSGGNKKIDIQQSPDGTGEGQGGAGKDVVVD